ncbi:MAG: hemolysin family protein [Rhodothalassiaceae bacterium]
MTDMVMHRIRRLLKRSNGSLRESLEDVIEQHRHPLEEKALRAEELELLHNIVAHADVRTEDIMVRRPDMVAIDRDAPFEDLIQLFIEAAHSRLPVYQDNLDTVTGMVHVKDALKILVERPADQPRPPISSIERPVLFVAPSMRALDLLAKMRANRIHMAVVVDEYGGTDGLVTIEDLVEQVVGEIHDEHDLDEQPKLIPCEDGRLDVDARVGIEQLAEHLDRPLLPQNGEDVDTVGGLVFTLAGRVPQIGEIVTDAAGNRFEVVDADPRRIKRVRVAPGPPPEPAQQQR